MTDLALLAAAWLGPDGHGNDSTGLRPWPAPLAAAFRQGDLADCHWSLLFDSDPARFSRMDLMSRLGLMAVELLAANLAALPGEPRDRVGVCVETCAGSAATDLRFLQTPRASLFTYTLPSTVLGEICIRHRLRGPVLCLVTPQPLGTSSLAEAACWLERGEAEACLCLSCEAVDRDTVSALPSLLADPPWHAAAALLGRSGASAPGHPVISDSLIESCRRLVRARA